MNRFRFIFYKIFTPKECEAVISSGKELTQKWAGIAESTVLDLVTFWTFENKDHIIESIRDGENPEAIATIAIFDSCADHLLSGAEFTSSLSGMHFTFMGNLLHSTMNKAFEHAISNGFDDPEILTKNKGIIEKQLKYLMRP